MIAFILQFEYSRLVYIFMNGTFEESFRFFTSLCTGVFFLAYVKRLFATHISDVM